jgi:hypothetical protein
MSSYRSHIVWSHGSHALPQLSGGNSATINKGYLRCVVLQQLGNYQSRFMSWLMVLVNARVTIQGFIGTENIRLELYRKHLSAHGAFEICTVKLDLVQPPG